MNSVARQFFEARCLASGLKPAEIERAVIDAEHAEALLDDSIREDERRADEYEARAAAAEEADRDRWNEREAGL